MKLWPWRKILRWCAVGVVIVGVFSYFAWRDSIRHQGDAKPVIYLYPTSRQNVEVTLHYNGNLGMTYPALSQGSWNVMAGTDGMLETGGRTYPYLFWEGTSSRATDFSEGFVVAGPDTVPFLEHSLDQLGLNSRESADFITYWAPQMVDNQYNVIHFSFGSEYDNIARLDVAPEPDSQIRVFMTFTTANDPFTIPPQQLSAPQREGFTLVEWGGREVMENLP